MVPPLNKRFDFVYFLARSGKFPIRGQFRRMKVNPGIVLFPTVFANSLAEMTGIAASASRIFCWFAVSLSPPFSPYFSP